MKKDVKLYNMILPPFMLFFFVPTLWIVSAVGNFIIDSIVLLIISILFTRNSLGNCIRNNNSRISVWISFWFFRCVVSNGNIYWIRCGILRGQWYRKTNSFGNISCNQPLLLWQRLRSFVYCQRYSV